MLPLDIGPFRQHQGPSEGCTDRAGHPPGPPGPVSPLRVLTTHPVLPLWMCPTIPLTMGKACLRRTRLASPLTCHRQRPSRIKWQGRELSFAFGEASTVDDLRSWLVERTVVAAEQQKLAGLASQRRQPSGGDLLAGINVGHRPLLLLGTPSAELRKAEAELEEGRRAAAKIRSDLTEPSRRRRSPQRTRVRRAADPRSCVPSRRTGAAASTSTPPSGRRRSATMTC